MDRGALRLPWLRLRLRSGAPPMQNERCEPSSGTPRTRACASSAAGGSGVGEHLLRRVAYAHPVAAAGPGSANDAWLPGPRITPESLPHPTVSSLGYVHDLHRHLAACDMAVVQGGLATTMELTAAGRPFLYFPLKHHFEQNLHVSPPARAPQCWTPAGHRHSPPDAIANAIEAARATAAVPAGRDRRRMPRRRPDRRAAVTSKP